MKCYASSCPMTAVESMGCLMRASCDTGHDCSIAERNLGGKHARIQLAHNYAIHVAQRNFGKKTIERYTASDDQMMIPI